MIRFRFPRTTSTLFAGSAVGLGGISGWLTATLVRDSYLAPEAALAYSLVAIVVTLGVIWFEFAMRGAIVRGIDAPEIHGLLQRGLSATVGVSLAFGITLSLTGPLTGIWETTAFLVSCVIAWGVVRNGVMMARTLYRLWYHLEEGEALDVQYVDHEQTHTEETNDQ